MHAQNPLHAPPARCSARSKRSGEQCRNRPLTGRGTCRMHGGKAGRPIEHGRYSALAGPLGDAYRSSVADANLLDPREPLAVLDALTKAQAARMEACDSPKFRGIALALVAELLSARKVGDGATEQALLDALAKHLAEGAKEADAEAELSRRIQVFARHNEEANRQKLAKAATVNAQFLVKLFAAVLSDVRARLDSAAAEAVAGILQARIDGGDPGGPLAIESAVLRGAGADVALAARRN